MYHRDYLSTDLVDLSEERAKQVIERVCYPYFDSALPA